jgi:porin
MLLVAHASAQEETTPFEVPPPEEAEFSMGKGILPIPAYTGDIWTRAFLTGDWGGTRADWANKGIQFQVDWNQYVQGVVDGGRDETTRYGGNLDYLLHLDLMRMDVLDGALETVRAESRYGHSVNGQAGPILPVNTDALFPITSSLDEDIPITVTDLYYTQFLSETFGVFLGKFDTLGGDPNEFASGRGTSQFMNANFVFNSVTARSTPYSTLGGGVVWMPTPYIAVSSSVYNTEDSSTTTGFDDFDDGTSWATEAKFQYRLGHLAGGQNVGFSYSWNNDFFEIGGRFVFQPGQGIIVPTRDETWFAYWSGWQYLFTDEEVEKPLDPTNGVADLHGIGVFARFGFADESTNPVEWSGSIGLGARGLIPGRLNDSCGIGYFYNDIQTTRLSGILGLIDHSQGFEAYYNIAITPAAALTLDVQVVEAPTNNLDTAVILGARLGLTF